MIEVFKEKMIEVFFDGSCMPTNPGTFAGYGFLVFQDGVLIKEMAGVAVEDELCSCNIGEYGGLVNALKFLIKENLQNQKTRIFGDSDLVIKQMSGQWRIKGGLYKELALECRQLVAAFPDISFSWIPREQNTRADELSKVCYDLSA